MRISLKYEVALETWLLGAEAKLFPAEALDLLTQSDSLTLKLEGLYGNDINVQIVNVFKDELDAPSAKRLGIKTGSEAVIREVFLVSGDMRLLFAQTIFPLIDAHGETTEMFAKRTEPLGKMLISSGAFTKEDVRIICIDDSQTMLNLGYPGANALFGRTYKLTIGQLPLNTPSKALVTEVFSPELISLKDSKKHFIRLAP